MVKIKSNYSKIVCHLTDEFTYKWNICVSNKHMMDELLWHSSVFQTILSWFPSTVGRSGCVCVQGLHKKWLCSVFPDNLFAWNRKAFILSAHLVVTYNQ